MARSSYVYTVTDDDIPGYNVRAEPYAGFTVKRELLFWLKKQDKAFLRAAAVWRMRDGGTGDPVKVPMAELGIDL